LKTSRNLEIIVSVGIKSDGSQQALLHIKLSKNISKTFEISNVQRRIFQFQIDTTTCEASCLGAVLGIVWDINDPTTQWPPATSDLSIAPDGSTVSSNVPPTISNKRKAPAATVTEEPSRNSERSRKVPKRLEDGFNSIAPL
jgi:hypothetical protein